MKDYLFKVLSRSAAKKELIAKGLKDIYQLEDSETGESFLGGRAAKKPSHLKASTFVKQISSEIDWEKQWELFAENFYEGKAHIDLSRFGKKAILQLFPGPGFGDLSHPTTALMLEMMQNLVQNRPVIDIGTGSGILALAALLFGASKAIGLDIDPKALTHARKNGNLNHLSARFVKTLPKRIPSENIFLINMTLAEQKIALIDIKHYNRHATLWIVSGILRDQKKEYLVFAKSSGWRL